MKNLLYLSIITIACAACHGKTQKSTSDSIVTDTTTAKDSNTVIIHQFKPLINGVWVAKDYVDDIGRTHSPYVSFDKLRGVASINIQLTDATKESIKAGISINNHEGSDFTIYLQHGHAVNFLKTNLPDLLNKENYYEVGYQVDAADTSLLLYHYNKAHQLIDHKMYKRVLPTVPNNDIGYGISYITNKQLVGGNYLNTDSLARNTEVSFGNDGKVSGLGGFKTYYLNADFSAEHAKIDEVIFDMESKDLKDYVFRIVGDTLSMYDIVPGTPPSMGTLRYKLVRKH